MAVVWQGGEAVNEKAHPYVWQMIREAVEALGGKTTNVAVRDWILDKYPGTNTSTIQAQIIVCTVNHPSRLHYPANQKPRAAKRSDDFLFRPERGKLELYDPERHGYWEIAENEDGRLVVHETDEEGTEKEKESSSGGGSFAAEDHLRDYLAANLQVIGPGLELYADSDGNSGVEFVTPVGRIDLLAVDKDGGFVVIELKVGRGSDAVSGQLLRYKNWVKRHLAGEKRVRGMLIAQHISDRIRYALAQTDDVHLKEYELSLVLRDVPQLDESGVRGVRS